MEPSEINERIAKICGTADLCHIEKRGMFYRPNAGGYTGSRVEAWKLPRAEAKKYEMYADRTDCPGEQVLLVPADYPDYHGSLDAMRAAWQTLTEPQKMLFMRLVERLLIKLDGEHAWLIGCPAYVHAYAFIQVHQCKVVA